jgi:hypothetical protein
LEGRHKGWISFLFLKLLIHQSLQFHDVLHEHERHKQHWRQ